MLTETLLWQGGVHDPTVGAWLVVVGYLVAVVCCLRTWRKARGERGPGGIVWLALAVLLLGLGANKQLDFQVLLIEVGRELARKQGWMAQRRVVLGVFLLGSMIGVVGLAFWAFHRMSGNSRAIRVALAASGFLVVTLLVQAGNFGWVSEFLQSDLFPGSGDALKMDLTEVVELGALGVIAWAACAEARGGSGGDRVDSSGI